MKIAHIIKSLNPGGVETWLKDLAAVSKDELHYVLHNNETSFYEDEVLRSGVVIKRVSMLKGMFVFSYQLYRYFKDQKFDVVHSHINLASGWILFIALVAGTNVRVAHCHNDKRSEYKRHNFVRKLYYASMKCCVHLFANCKISVSENCSSSMFFNQKENVLILPCGLDFGAKGNVYSRSDFGISKNDIVLMHVGRFVPQKNHAFLIDLMVTLKEFDNFKLFLIGEGDDFDTVKANADENNLSSIFFLGIRDDVKELMNSFVDFLLLPSHFEGLGLVAIESQSNNVYTLVSDNVPHAVKISSFIDFLSINDPLVWKNHLLNLVSHDAHIAAKTLDFDNSNFSIEKNARKLSEIYQAKESVL
jgi:glycosyltransferase involved in cell wall biosynthesis